MRFSIAVEHPGEWRPTVYRNGEVFRILRFRKWKTCGSMCFLWNISSLLSSPKGARPVDEVCEI